MNDRLHTVIAAPLTTGSRPAPSRVPVVFQERAGLILLDQIRALDKQRLIRRLGPIDAQTLRATLARLRDMFED